MPISLMLAALGCVRTQPVIVVITATPTVAMFPPQTVTSTPAEMLISSPTVPVLAPTADPTRPGPVVEGVREYTVQPGDTLSGIAQTNGVSLEALLAANTLANPDILQVGQVINLPAPPSSETSSFKILPDVRLIRGPGSAEFDVAEFIARQPGFIRSVTDIVNNQSLTAAQIVQRVSLEYSVDARLLLALLELRARWLSDPFPVDDLQSYPMETQASPPGFDRRGLYRQLAWAANLLNRGYYGWRYRGWQNLELGDGTRLRFGAGLNAGTVAVQYFLSQNTRYDQWIEQIGPEGLFQLYTQYFGSPFEGVSDPLIPPGLQQPELVLPFPPGITWFFTGGPHGGWGSGSAWSAVDFAPPDDRPANSEPCYVSSYGVTAVAPGVIARSGEGSVILDLDGDGDESTGWTILYLHVAADGRVQAGAWVKPGDLIGYPSCEGGFSNATHLHIARRYNGEWIPAVCEQCAPELSVPGYVLSGWTIYGLPNQEYQGYMINGDERRTAEQGRLAPDNRISW